VGGGFTSYIRVREGGKKKIRVKKLPTKITAMRDLKKNGLEDIHQTSLKDKHRWSKRMEKGKRDSKDEPLLSQRDPSSWEYA